MGVLSFQLNLIIILVRKRIKNVPDKDTSYFLASTPVNDDSLNVVARIPTAQLLQIIEEGFFTKLTDKDMMRIAVLLAQKGYEEGGCAIGGVVRDNETGLILGKGHNRHVQENRLYWHGETDAYNDAFVSCNPDFSKATSFTTLTPC